MIETLVINIGFVTIALLITANLYYIVKIMDKQYVIFDRFKKANPKESITWNQK